jgi:hypothetical protein
MLLDLMLIYGKIESAEKLIIELNNDMKKYKKQKWKKQK